MTPELYQRLKPLYEAALDVPKPQREAFVAEACGEDEELRRHLQSLLTANEEGTGPLDAPIFDVKSFGQTTEGVFAKKTLLLGRFEIVRHMGSGGMGDVYEARDLVLEPARIALKTIRSAIAQNPAILSRFKEEVKLARQVNGSNICRIYELYVPPPGTGCPCAAFLTMEFLEGVTLADRLAADGPIAPKAALKVAGQLCAALQSIHDARIVHRDLKPNNIMLVPRNGSERVVVMDFGLARALAVDSSTSETGLTVPGTIMGAPAYMAPEQFEGRDVSPATDIYALGIVLYELITGQQPFASPTPYGAAMRRARHPASPSSIRKGVPPVWDDVICKCMEFDQEHRYQSAAEVLAALNRRSLVVWRFSHGQRIALTPRMAALAAGVLFVLCSISGWSVYRAVTTYRPSQTAKRWYDDGVAALRDGTYLKAANALDEAVKSDPQYALAHARLADAWAELDSTGQAQQEMLRAVDAAQRTSLADEDKRYVDAVQATLIRNYSAAAQDYEELLKRLPEDRRADGLVDLGRVYEKAGKIKETIAAYEQAAKLNPDDPAPFVHIGIWKSRQRDPAGAEVAFTRAEELYRAKSNQEGLAEVAYQRGYAANERVDVTAAQTYIAKSLSIARQIDSPQLEARSLSQLSNVEYDDSNDPKGDDKAIEYANQAVRIAEANNLDYWKADGEMRLANAYLDKGDFDAAEFNAQQALHSARQSQHPRISAAAELTLASIRDQQGRNRDEQIEFAQDAFKYYSDYGFLNNASSAKELVARGQKSKGDLGPALQSAQELLELARKNGNDYYIEQAEETVGDAYYEVEDYPNALSHYEGALEASKTAHANEAYEEVHCASVLWRLGRYGQAEQALSSIPTDARARADIGSYINAVLARIDLSRGLYHDALDISKKSLSRFPHLSPGNASDFRAVMAQSEAALGQSREAQHDVDEALALAENSKDEALLAQAQLAEANVLVKLRMPIKAANYARSANSYFEAKGETESEWLSLLYLAEALDSVGSAEAAAATAKEALQVLSKLQSNWLPATFQQYSTRPDNQVAVRTLLTIKNQRGLKINAKT